VNDPSGHQSAGTHDRFNTSLHGKIARDIGFKAHDARLVAAMQTYAISQLLTFNVDDFKSFSITVIEPNLASPLECYNIRQVFDQAFATVLLFKSRYSMDNILTCLTPPGTAALAVLALYGPDTWPTLRGLFQPTLPDEPRPGTFRLGRLGDAWGRDEVVLAVKTGPVWPVLEIHCHGGQQVLLWLQEMLQSRGIIACSWPEFDRHLRMPAWQVEAKEALAHAPTTRTAAILLDQYHGAFQNALAQIADHLQRENLVEARRLLEVLSKRIALGRHLVEPWRIVIGGAVNVGKSSLVNALAGHARSVVSPTPGTTRDVVTTRLALDGWPVEVVDTAGWRTATEALEAAGIARAQAALEQADLVVWLLDGSSAPIFPTVPLARALFVINKIDMPAAWDHSSAGDARRVSASTGEGVTELCHHLANLLVPDPPAAKEAVPFTKAMCELIENMSDVEFASLPRKRGE
jgi:tRNA modification GTPase